MIILILALISCSKLNNNRDDVFEYARSGNCSRLS